MTRSVYKTMQGREVDMDSLLQKNETMPAVGNVRMNARGDELGPGGQITRRREDIVAEYYEDNPNARGSRTATPAAEPVAEKQQQPVAKSKKTNIEE
jgi:hypothetical protein